MFGLDPKEVARAGIDSELNSPAGRVNIVLVLVLGGIVIARNLSLPDAVVVIANLVAGRSAAAFQPPGLGEVLVLMAVVALIGGLCICGLGCIEVRKSEAVAEALGIRTKRKRKTKKKA